MPTIHSIQKRYKSNHLATQQSTKAINFLGILNADLCVDKDPHAKLIYANA